MGLGVIVTLPTGEMATLANSGIFELLDMVYKTPHNINFSIPCSHSCIQALGFGCQGSAK